MQGHMELGVIHVSIKLRLSRARGEENDTWVVPQV